MKIKEKIDCMVCLVKSLIFAKSVIDWPKVSFLHFFWLSLSSGIQILEAKRLSKILKNLFFIKKLCLKSVVL